MKKKLKKLLALILTLAIVMCLMPVAFAADTPVYAESITSSVKDVALYAGKTANLTVTVTPTSCNQGVIWTTSNDTVVAFGSGTTTPTATSALTSAGQSVQTITGIKAGTATVTASIGSGTSTSVQYSFNITVNADSVSSVTITTANGNASTAISSATLYKGASLQLYTLTTYASGATDTGSIKWETSNANIVNRDDNGLITAIADGTAIITARSTVDNKVYKSISVAVSSTPAIAIKEDSGKSTVVIGKTLSLTAYATNNYPLEASKMEWATSDSSVAKLSNSSGSLTPTLTGVKDGKATVTAKYTYPDPSNNTKTQTVSATYAVTVSGGDITAVSLDARAYLGLYSNGALTAVSTPANGTYKTVSWTSSNPYVVTVSGSTLTATIYGGSEGTATVTAVVTSTNGNIYTASCQVTVTDLTSVNASDAATIGTNMTLANISDMLTAKFVRINGVYPSTSATITFSSLGSSTYGTLYTSSSTLLWNTAKANTAYKFSDLAAMTFVPSTSGAYALPYTIKDAGTGYTMSGVITINIGTNSLVVNVDLSSNAPYLFSSAVNADGVAASTLIANAVYARYAKACGSIMLASSATTGVGTLYADSSKTAISTLSSGRTFYYSGTTRPVSSLYFVPAASGTYVRAFTAYDVSGNKLGDCELHIIVPDNLISAYYNIKPNSTLSFDENLFASWYENVSGASYLSYVTIDGASNSTGTFSYDTTSFLPGSGVVFYSTTYSGTKPTNPRYIGNVKYKSANSSYSTYVNFTCYGGTTSGATGIVRTGTLAICVAPGTVSDIDYAVTSGTPKTLDSASFTSVYRSATNTTVTSAFRIQILKVPVNGSLYYNYTSSTSKGALLTNLNCASYQLFANNSSATYVIDKLTYVPTTNFGSESVYYAVYNTSGTLLYCGKVAFNTGSKTFICYSEGYTYNASDFPSNSDTDTIVSIKFGVPSSGSLYYNYANGGGVAVTNTMKFYTRTARTGEIAITKLTYIPAAGYSGKITISYTATTSLGKTQTGTLVMTVNRKTASSYFTDVTAANTGSWAANAIDYCASWSLVSGTGTSTFSPSATMNRAMLVAVLYKAAGSPAVSGSNPFKDVSSSQYYYKAVLWANANGIVTGTGTKTFSPNGAVTREQIATILYKYAKHGGTPVTASASLSGYSDRGSISSYAVTAMQWAVGSGIISGTSTTTISPKASASRAQVAVMLHKYLTT